jgi:type IV pilus assembly protein PilC
MRTLSSLISSGVSMVEAIRITGEVLQNPRYVAVMKKAGEEVQAGAALSTIFTREEYLYPILVGEMAEVGEETGKLSEMLLKAALFYEGEIDAVTKNLSTIIEPLLMVFIGIAVGFFAVSMIQPMYSLSDII